MTYFIQTIPFLEPPGSLNWPKGDLGWAQLDLKIAIAQEFSSALLPGILGFDIETLQTSVWDLPAGARLLPSLSGGGWWACNPQGLYHLRWKQPAQIILPLESMQGWQMKKFIPYNPTPPYLLAWSSPNQQGGRFFSVDAQPRVRQKWSVPHWGGGDISPAQCGWWVIKEEYIEYNEKIFSLILLNHDGRIESDFSLELKNTPKSLATNKTMTYLIYLTDFEIILIDVQNVPFIVSIHAVHQPRKIIWIDEQHFFLILKNQVTIWKYTVTNSSLKIIQTLFLPNDFLKADFDPKKGLIIKTTAELCWIQEKT